MKHLILNTIAIYKKTFFVLRALRIPVFVYTDCKFYPSCSDYAVESVNKYGVMRGSVKSVTRILKCSPFSRGGMDMP